MNDRDQIRLECAQRVDIFGNDNATDFPAGTAGTTEFSGIKQLLADLGKAVLGQVRLPVSKETLLDALRLDLQDIAGTARSLAKKDKNPAFAAPYRLPDDARFTEHALLTHADAVFLILEDQPADTADAKAAKAALRARFVTEYSMDANFVVHLRADRDAITRCNAGKISDNNEGNESTVEIGLILGKLGDHIEQLKTICKNKYQRADQAKYAAWQRASRLERRPRSNPDLPPAPPAPPTP